ncbi:hypothetical protein DB42_AA00530 [Neochlamydia sp. EPS4]|uniref:DUF1347 family protein n=1 Tax=Neochlamydia sp. EPS4 TaxID=1478175 RepID=UPI0005834AA6|nr:DUF1347 family protein [Neochlamydia sp. EPS4]KIC75565.1 hypothetical protein DB42_AA00530 [Neochlamydia sp. EPS4]
MSYFKIFTLSFCFSLLFIALFIGFAFDSRSTLDQTYEYFASQQYDEARRHLLHGDHPISLADFYLYEGYITREKLGAEKSQPYFLEALQHPANKRSNTAFELSLNLALNAFLQKDPETLHQALDQCLLYTNADHPWFLFFKGNYFYLLKDYPQALTHWQASQSRPWLSKWMEASFQHHLPEDKVRLNCLYAQIELGQLEEARQALKEMLFTSPAATKHDANLLLALSYRKEAETLLPPARPFAFQKAADYLQLLPEENVYYIQEKSSLAHSFKEQLLQEIEGSTFINLPLYLQTLERMQASTQLEEISKRFAQRFTEMTLTGNIEEASHFIQGIADHLHEGNFNQLLASQLTASMQEAIIKGRLHYWKEGWILSQKLLSSDSSCLPTLINALTSKILGLLEDDSEIFKEIYSYLGLWQALEKRAFQRYTLARQLLQKAECLWSLKNEPQKAIDLIKLATSLPFEEELKEFQQDIERAVIKIYRQAVLQDNIHQFAFIQQAVQQFNFNSLPVLEAAEIANQIADAQYLYKKKQFTLAADKALGVLKVTPCNQAARRIAALAAYQEGKYFEVVEHAKHLNSLDFSILEPLAISMLITGEKESASFLRFLSDHQPLSDDNKLRLGLGYLLVSQPEPSISWLTQIQRAKNDGFHDEVLLGFYIAAFQKQDWPQVINLYSQLTPSRQQIPAVQGMIIQSYLAQDQREQAEELFATFLKHSSFDFLEERGSTAYNILKKHLYSFNAYDFAARYFLYVKKDLAQALSYFREVKNPLPDLLLERAQLAYTLKNYPESIKDLHEALQNAQGSPREKALLLLGQIYFEIGLYPDSVSCFKELFALNCRQDLSVHRLYGQALTLLGRPDLASMHFRQFEIDHLALSSLPQNFDIDLKENKSLNKRQQLLEHQLQLYPQSISLQLLSAKELVFCFNYSADSCDDRSEKLLLAHEILKKINEKHSYLPEAWYLQGQVLTHLKLNRSAKQAFSKAIDLNPYYVEAYKQLAIINKTEKDFGSALYHLRQVLQIAPHDEEAWRWLACIEEEQNHFSDAIQAWSKALKLHPLHPLYLLKLAHLSFNLHATEWSEKA